MVKTRGNRAEDLMSILQKVQRLAAQQLREEHSKYPGGNTDHFDWCVDYAVRRLPTTEFVQLLEETIGLSAFFDTGVSPGSTIRAWLAHDRVVSGVVEKLEK